MSNNNPITDILHTPFPKKDAYGALNIPIYSNVAFEADTAEELEDIFNGRKPAHVYSRISNPTVQYFEERIRNLSGAATVTALASGMAAISTLFITLAQAGDNIITSKHLFGNTYSLFENTLKPLGFNTKYTDLTNTELIKQAIDNNTRAIFVETITNPQLEVANIKAIAQIAKEHNILLIADTTITPSPLFKSKEHGIHIEVISSTKYISGGATSVGGLIIDNGTYNWANSPKFKENANKYGNFALALKLKRETMRDLGTYLSPHNAYLQSIGLETLTMRMEKSCQNTLKLAKYLEINPKVKSVNYPALEKSKFYSISQKQFPNGAGAVLTFRLEDKKQCFQFMNKLKLIRRATNINDNKTLVIHPASTIFCEYAPELKQQMSVYEDMIRISVGIEEIEQLKEDINQALS